MSFFDQEEFNRFIIENNVLEIKKVKLRCERESEFYVNWRKPMNKLYLADEIIDSVLYFVKDKNLNLDCFYGPPEGATKLAILLGYARAQDDLSYLIEGEYTIPMGRGKPKDHGDPEDRYFVGEPKGKVLLIEDSATTARSVLEELDKISELEEAEVVGVLFLTDRMQLTPIPGKDNEKVVQDYKKIFEKVTGLEYKEPMSVKEAINKAGFSYYALSKATDLLSMKIKKTQPPEKIIKSIEDEFAEYGVQEIKLR